MSRKKKHEHVNHERWLVSYADFITLLFAFFVVLFASSQGDKKKQAKVASSMQAAFSAYGIFEPRASKMPLAPGSVVSPDASSALTQELANSGLAPNISPSVRIYSRTHHALEQSLARSIAEHAITLRSGQEGEVLSLHEAAFFDSGSATIKPSAIPLLQSIARALPTSPIRIEGHTDNVPIHNLMFRSNWELSTDRASNVARFLMQTSSVAPSSISLAGYAEFHPIASNLTEAGRLQNRRVDIVLPKQIHALASTSLATTSPSPHQRAHNN